MDGHGVKVFVQKNEKYGIPILHHIYGAEPLAGLAIREQTAAFDLKTTNCLVAMFDCIVSLVTGWSQFHSKDTGRFVFGDLSGDPEGFPRQSVVFLRKFLGFAKNLHDTSAFRHISLPPRAAPSRTH
jgi:hypothetical protein